MKTQLLSLLVALIVVAPSLANNVYLIGEAAPGGWSLDEAVQMQPTSEGVYEFVGDLKDGELKFVTQLDWVPSYGPQENGASLTVGTIDLALRASNDDPDNKFNVKAGRYALTLRIDAATQAAQLLVADGTGLEDKWYVAYPDTIYAIGSATEVDWTVSEAIVMEETAENSGVYVDTLVLKSGELKFLCQKDWGAGYGATVANDPINDAGVYTLAALDDSDKKFLVNVAEPTEFIVEVNVVTNTLTLTAVSADPVVYPETLYILGPAVGGWSLDDNAQAMNAVEEGVYVWKGSLAEGEMKFFVEKDFSAPAYGATVAGVAIEAAGEYALELLGDEDKKFVVSPMQNIQLTVNLKEMNLLVAEDTASALDIISVEGTIMVYDLTGRHRVSMSSAEFNTINLPSGIYILKSGEKTGKIVVK